LTVQAVWTQELNQGCDEQHLLLLVVLIVVSVKCFMLLHFMIKERRK